MLGRKTRSHDEILQYEVSNRPVAAKQPSDLGQQVPNDGGIDEVKQIDDKTFDGIISATVGPISGKFNFRSTIVESRPPEQMVVRTEGTDSVTKSTVNADMTVDLHSISDAKSQMDYQADVKIKGRLAILGDMVLRATATLILQEFTRRLRKGLGEQA